MSDGITYFLVGHKHSVLLAVSIYTLRETGAWDGPVEILSGDDRSLAVAHEFIKDQSAGEIRVKSIPHKPRKNGAYQTKTTLNQFSDFALSVFLDCDTILTGRPIDEMFPRDPRETVLTRFSDWVTNGRMMSGRINRWSSLLPVEVKRMTSEPFPAINNGVVGMTPHSEVFPPWNELCRRQEERDGKCAFISDESCINAIYPDYDCRVVDDRYNWSPQYGKARMGDVAVVHLHGRKHVRGKHGPPMWKPWFLKAVADNFAGVREWGPSNDTAAFRHHPVDELVK